MAVVHRVILLNKSLKIRGYTLLQWGMLILAVALAFGLGSYMPKEWKFGNLPAGVLVFVAIVSAAFVFIHASEMKPWLWWKNQLFYRLHLKPTKFLPHPEPSKEYPDSSIIDPIKQKDRYYVQQKQR